MLPVTDTEKTLPPQISHAERDKMPSPNANPPSPSVNSTPFIKPRTQHLRGFMPENKHSGFDEYAGLKSEGFSQRSKRSREDDPEALLGPVVAAKGKKFKPDGSSSNRGPSGGSRVIESIRASRSWDLMVRGTANGEHGAVNGFDLAAIDIMSPSQASPTKQGFERTGTKPFMAITLLQAEDTKQVTQRQCAHDLESVIWCLAWYVLLGNVDWQEGTYSQVGSGKRTWIADVYPHELPEHNRAGTEHLWAPLTMAAYKWSQRQDDVFKGLSEYSEKTNIELIDRWLPCPKRPDGEEWDFK